MDPGPGNYIREFLLSEHILTLSFPVENDPHSVNLFFVYDPDRVSLYFFSSPETLHSRLIASGGMVSGTVHHSTRLVQDIRGIQFRGSVATIDDPGRRDRVYLEYEKRFPEIRNIPARPYEVRLDWMKWTDNRRGFGHKEIWKRKEVSRDLPD